MEVLTSAPTTSSLTKDAVTISAQQESSPQSSAISLPTITETPDPPVEEAQESGTYVVIRYISYYGMLCCKPLRAGTPVCSSF